MFSFSFAELFVDGKGWGVNISPWSYARFQFASHESLVKVRDCVIPGFRERSSSWVKSVFFGWVERCGLLVGQKKENGQQQPIMFPWLPMSNKFSNANISGRVYHFSDHETRRIRLFWSLNWNEWEQYWFWWYGGWHSSRIMRTLLLLKSFVDLRACFSLQIWLPFKICILLTVIE